MSKPNLYRIVVDYQSADPIPPAHLAQIVYLALAPNLPVGRILSNTVFTEADLQALQRQENETEEAVAKLLTAGVKTETKP